MLIAVRADVTLTTTFPVPVPMTGQFTAAANKREGHTHVLLITTGSVASIKAPLIVEELLKVSSNK